MKQTINDTKQRVSRKNQQKRKQIIFLVVLALAVAGVLAGFLIKAFLTRPAGSSSLDIVMSAEEDDDTIVYDGKKYTYNDHLSNYLIMGIDASDTVDAERTQADVGQADSIFLISHDRQKNTLQCLAIPRDTMAEIESFSFSGNSQGIQMNHLNLQYAYGDGKHKSCDLMKTAVSRLLYGVPIQSYCSVKMDAVPILVDIVGGVEVTVSDDSLQEVYPEFAQGSTVTLTKDNVLSYIRFRDTNQENSALVRQQRHKGFLEAFLKKVQTISAKDAGIVADLYEDVQDYMVTNMGNDVFVKLLDASKQAPVISETLPGEGAAGEYHDEYHVDEDALYGLIIQMFYEEVQ